MRQENKCFHTTQTNTFTYVHVHTPWPGVVLQGLQPRLHQVQRLEEQRGACAAEGAAHEGFESWMSLRTQKDGWRDGERKRRDTQSTYRGEKTGGCKILKKRRVGVGHKHHDDNSSAMV